MARSHAIYLLRNPSGTTVAAGTVRHEMARLIMASNTATTSTAGFTVMRIPDGRWGDPQTERPILSAMKFAQGEPFPKEG